MHRLREGETTIADDYPSVTVLFADIVGFTSLASRRSAAEIVGMLDDLFSTFDEMVAQRELEKIKTIGDAYMVAGGLTDPDGDHARRVVDLGLAMQAEVEGRGGDWADLKVRVGAHTGPAAGGVIGRHKFAFDLWGDTVNTASRLEQHGLPGYVHISAQTWSHVRDDFACELRGQTELRGKGAVETYLVVGRRATPHTMPTDTESAAAT
jgi:adenylate cyclase